MFSKGYLTFYGISDISFHYSINPRSQNYYGNGSRRANLPAKFKKKVNPQTTNNQNTITSIILNVEFDIQPEEISLGILLLGWN